MTNRQNTRPMSDEQNGPVPCHHAEDLMAGGQSAHIKLADQLYTLRITRAGKLILTK